MTAAGIAIGMYAKPYTRRRTAAGSYVDGRWQNGAPSETTIYAAIFHVRPADLLTLPEGNRAAAQWTAWTLSGLQTDDEDAGTVADQIYIGGTWFRVASVSPRAEGGFFKAILERSVARNRSVPGAEDVVAGGDWH